MMLLFLRPWQKEREGTGNVLYPNIFPGTVGIPLNSFSREIVARKPSATNSRLFRVYFTSMSSLVRYKKIYIHEDIFMI
jgi:hypothetical protein